MTTAEGDQAATAYGGPGSFQLDPAASSVSIAHKMFWGLGTVRGSFTKLSGSAEIIADGSGRGRLEIDAASIDTKNAKRDQHLRSKDFFHADEHPQLVVEVTQAARQGLGADNVAATGTLTAAGQARPLTVSARITQETDDAITLTAEADIDRADFGMRWNQLGMITGKAHVSVVARFVKTAAGK
jgi:polyisoprenoid-binding protein YceI